jgi:membrane protease YdiL (CAAX protease family)
MAANNTLPARTAGSRQRPEQIASWGRLVGFLLIGAGVVALGIFAQHAPAGGGAQAGQLASHGKAIPIYLSAIFMDWALLYYCWVAVHHSGGNLETLSGGRWNSWKDVVVDVGIALPFWVLWTGAAFGVHWLLALRLFGAGAGSVKTVASLLPQSPLEIVIWIGTSITAGICEEMAFRGFLQRQLHALTGNIGFAVLGQGVVFGLMHSYQGWTNVVVISVLGMLFGALAAWRGNVRATMIAHAWGDIWEGWLKFVVWR